MKYKVLQPIKNQGKFYQVGSIIDLDERTAAYLNGIVIPIPESLETIPDEASSESEVKKISKPNKGK